MSKPTLKMKILFDEDKVKREGKYDIEEMYAIVDDYFASAGLPKIAKGEYVDKGHKDDYAKMLMSIGFKKKKWFISNLSQWEYLNVHDDEPDEWYYEDLLEECMSV